MNASEILNIESCIYSPVRLDQIDMEDRSFEVRSYASHEHLYASIEHVGLLSPPWLLKVDNDGFIIVDGFKRLRRLNEEPGAKAVCLVFPENFSRSRLLLWRIEGKLFGQPLNAAEKAQVLAMASRSYSFDAIAERILPLLRIPPRPDYAERWIALASSGDDVLEAAASDIISDRVALEISGWERDARDKMVVLFKALRCSVSIQTEIVERLEAITRRRNKTRIEILLAPGLQGIFNDSSANRREKTQMIRDQLRAWAFPRLTARELRFSEAVGKASLPESMHIVHPPAFEGESWQLQLTFSTPRDLTALLERARELAGSSVLSEITSHASEDL
jgi:hypothetical protein